MVFTDLRFTCTDRYSGWRGVVAAGVLAVTLSACSVSTAPLIERTGPGISTSTTVTLTGASGTPTQDKFRAALERHFASYGIPVSNSGALVVDYSMSARPAEIGLATTRPDPVAGTAVDYVSIPREDEFLQECRPQRLRATMVIFDRGSGSLQYRGVREITLCDISATSIEEMAAELVKDAQLG